MQFQKIATDKTNLSITTPVKWNFKVYNILHSQTSFILHNWNTRNNPTSSRTLLDFSVYLTKLNKVSKGTSTTTKKY